MKPYNPNFSFIYLYLKQLTFLLFFGFLNFTSNYVNAQKIESVYSSELKTGSNIYVITNREEDKSREYLSFKDKIKTDSNLVFLKVTFHQPDSISNQILERSDFMNQVSNIPTDWLLFIHGDSKTYEQAVMRGFDIQYLHNVNVIVFSWPSKNPDINGLKNYKKSKENVVKSMIHFNELIGFMDSFKRKNNAFNENAHLSMFLHSLGNSYLENFIKENKRIKNYNTIFDNVIINSAAVNQKMHKDWVEKINFQKRIYISNNKSDFNLKGAHIFTKDGNQLGEKAKAPIAKNANYIQFSEAVGFRFPTGTTHTFFIGDVPNESKNIRDFYFDVLHGNQIDLSKQSQFKKRKDGIGYDIIF